MTTVIRVALSAAMLICQDIYATSVVILIHPGAARAVLLDPPVFQYLHTELPQRQPILLSDRLLVATEAELDLPFDVVLVRAGDKRERDAFTFTGSERGDADTLVVTFAFAPEGMEGRATLRHDKDQWRVVARKVWEH